LCLAEIRGIVEPSFETRDQEQKNSKIELLRPFAPLEYRNEIPAETRWRYPSTRLKSQSAHAGHTTTSDATLWESRNITPSLGIESTSFSPFKNGHEVSPSYH
jgi:hypothetical protein